MKEKVRKLEKSWKIFLILGPPSPNKNFQFFEPFTSFFCQSGVFFVKNSLMENGKMIYKKKGFTSFNVKEIFTSNY